MAKGDRNDGIRLFVGALPQRLAVEDEARAIVDLWNAQLSAGTAPQFSPTLG